jgi:hypothetical protein
VVRVVGKREKDESMKKTDVPKSLTRGGGGSKYKGTKMKKIDN